MPAVLVHPRSAASLMFASWNLISVWLVHIDALRRFREPPFAIRCECTCCANAKSEGWRFRENLHPFLKLRAGATNSMDWRFDEGDGVGQ
jgi:hypothetical protein